MRKISRYSRAFMADPRKSIQFAGKKLGGLGQRFDYHLLGRWGLSRRIRVVHIELTHRCNLRCLMCFFFGLDRDVTESAHGAQYRSQEELTLAQLKGFLDEVAHFRPAIGLTGGEPMLSPHCLDVVRLVKGKRLNCGLTTNGTLLSGFAEEIVASKLDWLSLSLDGPDNIHDRIRGVPGTFRRLTNGVDLIQQMKKRKKAKTPEIGIKFTLVGDNYRYLEETIQLAVGLGATHFTATHLFFCTEEMARRHNQEFGPDIPCSAGALEGLQRLDPLEAARILPKIRKKKWPLTLRFIPDLTREEILTYYDEPARFVKAKVCRRPWNICNILPNGDVLPCLNFVAGNLKNAPFSEIWNGRRYRTFRQILHREGAFPACARCCGMFDL